MIRRTALAALALAVVGMTAPALADSPAPSPQVGEHGVCVGLVPHGGGPLQGVCVWVPTR